MENKFKKYKVIKIISHFSYGVIWFLIVSFMLNIFGLGELTDYSFSNLIENIAIAIFGWATIILFWIKLYIGAKKFIKHVNEVIVEEAKAIELGVLFNPNRPVTYKCALNPFC